MVVRMRWRGSRALPGGVTNWYRGIGGVVVVQSGEHGCEVGDADGFLVEVRGLDRAKAEGGGEDEAEQAHATEGGPEEVGMLAATGGDDLAAGEQDGHAVNGVAEAAWA